MILWVILFFLIIAISFVLALRSMKDYVEIPQKLEEEYGLFLIRKTGNFNALVLDSLIKLIPSAGLIFSLERLFKGTQTVLTIFGPKAILDKFKAELGLLELEDYAADFENLDVAAWELGVKDHGKFNPESLNNIFNNLPPLAAEDQFFWQVIPGKSRTQIRAALYSKDADKRTSMVPLFQNLKIGELIRVPKPFSKEQMISFYKLRSLNQDNEGPVLTSEGVIRIVTI